MIKLDAVVKKYGAVTALDKVTLSVEKGSCFALLGANGAGKTTVIRLLLDFTRQNSGTVVVNGIPAADASARKCVGYMPENVVIPPYLTGEAYLHRVVSLLGFDGRECIREIDRLLDIVDMKEKRAVESRAYSKGMVQRIGFAAALAGSPQLLVLDEPTNGLDPVGMRDFRTVLERLRHDKVTILLNSHILSEVEKVCDAAAILHKGLIKKYGTISDLIAPGITLEDTFVKYAGDPA